MSEKTPNPENIPVSDNQVVDVIRYYGVESDEATDILRKWRLYQESQASSEDTSTVNIKLLIREADIYRRADHDSIALDILSSARDAAAQEEDPELYYQIDDEIDDIESWHREEEFATYEGYSDDSSEIQEDDEKPGLDEMLNNLIKLMSLNSYQKVNVGAESKDYDFFEFDEERNELFYYCKSVAEYLHNKEVADLIIIDRSSRPMYIGIKEYWRHRYPHDPMPGIYFLNPTGFIDTKETPIDALENIKQDLKYKDNSNTVSSNSSRSKQEIDTEFGKIYKRLLKDKTKPVLVFDSCIHSGDTLSPVIESMKRIGFKDIHIGSINPADMGSKVINDYFITLQRPEKGCYPFDRDRIIEKTLNHVYSERTRDPQKMDRSVRLRQEIKKIIEDKIAEEI